MTAQPAAPPLRFCSIVAANYLPQVRVLAATLERWMPRVRLTVLVIDVERAALQIGDEPFDIVSAGDVGIEPREYHRMAAIYEVIELATAVKPWLLLHLLNSGAGAAVYLDPDVYVCGPLGALEGLIADHGIVLTPHFYSPRNGSVGLPELTLLRHGVLNLGFLGVSPASVGFLEWWQDRLRRQCLRDDHPSVFVDQRWIDEIQSFWSTHVIHEPTWNVAYWNAEDRVFTRDGETWYVDGQRLHFFHFSGFDPLNPNELTWHREVRANLHRFSDPGLRGLCEEYATALRAEGWPSSVAYGWARSAGGRPMTRALRSTYRRDLLAAEAGGRDLPDPFEVSGTSAFERWRRRRLPFLLGEDTLRRWVRALRAETRRIGSDIRDLTGRA